MTTLLSERGIKKIQERIKVARAQHQLVHQELSAAMESNDDRWRDNPKFDRLHQMVVALSHKFVGLKSLLEDSRMLCVKEGERPCDCVHPGSAVEIECTDKDSGMSNRTFWIIGGDGDSDWFRGILGRDAPLARVLALARPGDVIGDVRIGHRIVDIEVLALYPRVPLETVSESRLQEFDRRRFFFIPESDRSPSNGKR